MVQSYMTPIAGCSHVLVDVLEWYAHSMVLESSDECNIQFAAEQIVQLLSILGLKTGQDVSSKSHGSSLSLSLPLLDSSNSLLLEDHVLNRLRLATLVHSICGRERWGKDPNVLEQILPLDWQQMKLMLEDCRKHMKPSKDSCNNNHQYIDIAYRDVMNLLECHTILADFLHNSESNDNQQDIHQVSIRLNNLKTRLRKLTFSTLGTKTHTTNKVTAPMAIVEFLRQDILSSPKRYINVYQKAQDHVQSLIHTIGQPYSYDTLQCKVQTLARIWSESMLGIPTLIQLQYGGLSTETFDPMTLVGPIAVATDDTKSISSWGMDDDDDACTDEEINTKVVNNRTRKTMQKKKQHKSEKPRIISTHIPPNNAKTQTVRPVVASEKQQQQASRYKNSHVKNSNNNDDDDDDDATVLEEDDTAVAIPPMQIRPREHWKESFEILDGLNESDVEVALMQDKRAKLTNVNSTTTPKSNKQSTKITSRYSLPTFTNRKLLPKQEGVTKNLTSEAIFMKLIQIREQQEQEKQQLQEQEKRQKQQEREHQQQEKQQQQQGKQHKNIPVDPSNPRPNKTLTGTKRHGNEAPMEPKSLHRHSLIDATKKMKEKVKPIETTEKTKPASTLGVDVSSPTKSVKLQSKERMNPNEQPHQVYASSISSKTSSTTQDPLSKTIPTITNAIRSSIPTMTTIPTTTSAAISKKSVAIHKKSHASKFLIPKSDSIRRFRRRFFHEIVD